LIFGRVAGLSTDGLPMLVFYLAGVTIWNYFSETLNKTATVFKDNAQMFGKVYFPRLTMPVSIVISNLVRFLIQFLLFLFVWSYYLLQMDSISPNFYILLTPLLVAIMGVLALGFGMIISALTTKYRDLIFLLTFGIQLLMYATPVIYPLSSIPEQYKLIILANPMSSIIETFRYGFLGSGTFSWFNLLYSFLFSIAILILGTVVFNRVEKSFTDTV
jgi:lipopolysaccharide transport system permease protein